MIAKLPYPKWADVTPCTIVLTGPLSEDGEAVLYMNEDGEMVPVAPSEAGPSGVTWSGNVNYSEKAKRVQDKDGKWVRLSGVIHKFGDILPGVQFTGGKVTITGYPERSIVGYARPRNPDGTINHTRLELM